MSRLRIRSELAIIATCIALYVGAAAQIRAGGRSSLAVAVTAVTSPIVGGANRIGATWSDLVAGRRDLRSVLQELSRLRAEAARLRRTNQLLTSEVAELRQGSRLLAAFPRLEEQAILARVVARDVLTSSTVRLDKGTADGVHLDAAVIAESGVMGRVDQISASTARVQLLSHPAAAAAVRIVGVDGEALLEGGERPRLIGLPPYTEVPVEAPILTTGSEGVYPPGLLLGVTEESSIQGIFTIVAVRLATRPAEVAVVLVLPATGVQQ